MNNNFFYEKIKDIITIINNLKSDIKNKDKKISDVEKSITEINTILGELKNKNISNEIVELTSKLLKKTEKYQIKDGYWYYENEKLVKAIGKDGKDGKDGINGKDGKDGKNGEDGRDFKFSDFTVEQLLKLKGKDGANGINGKNGKDGANGKDAIIPDFELGTIETISAGQDATATLIKKGNKYKLNLSIPRGVSGGNGRPATINGLNAINILAGENIELEQTEDNLTINATATPQIQSDMAQEDDTALDYIKNKHANYINATLYEEDEEGEQIPIYEGTANELLNLYLYMISDNYESLYDEIDQKQDPLEDIPITIYYSGWVDNEVTVYCNVMADTQIWYSPTEDSYDDFVDSEIRMTEQGSGYVKFKCETTPEENIDVLIRRA